jgi:hypothetical protein
MAHARRKFFDLHVANKSRLPNMRLLQVIVHRFEQGRES